MGKLVRLTYTPRGGTLTNLDIRYNAARGLSSPDDCELFPGIKHRFLDGTLAEEIAGGRRNIELDFGANISQGNLRRLIQFWLDKNRVISSLAAQVSGENSALVDGGSLTNGYQYDYCIVACDGIGGGQHSGETAKTATSSKKTIALTWTSVSDARFYKIYRTVSTDGGNTWSTWELYDYSDTNSYTDAGLVTAIRDEDPPDTATQVSAVNDDDTFVMDWLGNSEVGRSLIMRFNEATIWTEFPE